MKKLFAALSLLAISCPSVAEDQLSLGTGFDYSSGTYGNATSTDILYIPVTGKYESDRLTLKLTVPYIRVTGPGGVVRGMGRTGMTSVGGSRARTGGGMMSTGSSTSNAGLGDITTSAAYNVYSDDALAFDLVGNIKLGTANASKGLGTGKNDYSAQIDGYYTSEETTLFGTAGYKVYGSPVAGVTLNNTPYFTIGASEKLSNTSSAGVMLDMAKSSNIFSADQREVTVYLSQKLTPDIKVQAHALKGFSNGSPDFGGGVIITGYF